MAAPSTTTVPASAFPVAAPVDGVLYHVRMTVDDATVGTLLVDGGAVDADASAVVDFALALPRTAAQTDDPGTTRPVGTRVVPAAGLELGLGPAVVRQNQPPGVCPEPPVLPCLAAVDAPVPSSPRAVDVGVWAGAGASGLLLVRVALPGFAPCQTAVVRDAALSLSLPSRVAVLSLLLVQPARLCGADPVAAPAVVRPAPPVSPPSFPEPSLPPLVRGDVDPDWQPEPL